jgi:hypothetical protein
MTSYTNFLAVSYSEFQCLYNFGTVSVISSRLTSIPLNDSGDPVDDPHCSATMLGRSPAYSPNDEEGILLLSISEFATAAGPSGYLDPVLLSVSFSSVIQVVPLCERSFRILNGRLRDMGITLSQPFFANSARVHRMKKIKQSSLRAGAALVDLLSGGNCEPLPDKITMALGLALYKVEYPNNELFDSSVEQDDESILPTIFGYTRHEAAHNTNTDCFEDLGLCLNGQYGKDAPVVTDYRKAWSDVRARAQKTGSSVADVVRDERFCKALYKIAEKYDQYFPIHPLSISVFLKWKDQFHRSDGFLDLPSLREECQSVAELVGRQVVEHALWLIGCYIGHDRMAILLYSHMSLALSVFEGKRHKLSPISFDTRQNKEIVGAKPEIAADAGNGLAEVLVRPDEQKIERVEQPERTPQSSASREGKVFDKSTPEPRTVADENKPTNSGVVSRGKNQKSTDKKETMNKPKEKGD